MDNEARYRCGSADSDYNIFLKEKAARYKKALEEIASQIEDGYNEYYVKTAKKALEEG